MSFAAESPDLVVTLLDISRAYFNADIGRTVHVELPGEAGFSKGFVALLHKCMYGTRDAAKGWEAKYCDVLLKLGFKRGSSSPCLFIHKSRNIRLCVHGDDFHVQSRREVVRAGAPERNGGQAQGRTAGARR